MGRFLCVCFALTLLAVACDLAEAAGITPAQWDKAYTAYSNERAKCGSNKACIKKVNQKYLPQAKLAAASNLLSVAGACKNGEAYSEIQYRGGTIEGPAPCH